MKQLKAAVFGAGFVGRVHIEAIRRLGNVEVAAVADDTDERARQLGEQLSIPKIRWRLPAHPGRPLHRCGTHLHAQRAASAHGDGRARRPASTCSAKSRWPYRPMTAAPNGRGRARRATAAIARSTICVTTPWCSRCAACARPATWARSWWCRAHTRRIGCSTTPIGTGASKRKDNGPSRCMADIGSHWCDMAEHVTGQRIASLCADLNTFHKTRKRPKGPIETFAGKTLKPEDYVETPIDTEDFGAVVFRMDNDARGAFTASQVSAGRKNRLSASRSTEPSAA